jgi:hypothetical protein
MATATVPTTSPWMEDSVFDLAQRLAQLLADVSPQSPGGQLPDQLRERVADLADAIRRRTAKKADRDLRSLFDLDDRFIELMDRADDEISDSGQISEDLTAEMTQYLEAFRTKVDRISGYWRWQETIAQVCGEEADRLFARKKAADGRVKRLKGMLLAFMMSRGHRKLEGERTSIGMQRNSSPALVIDDRQQIADGFYQCQIHLSKAEVREFVERLDESELRRRLETLLKTGAWEVNEAAVRADLLNNFSVEGAHLATGHHVRIR